MRIVNAQIQINQTIVQVELSEDFQAKMTVEQLRTQLGQFGITPEQMFDQMNTTLNRMKSQLEQSSS